VVAIYWLGNNRHPWDLEMMRGDVAIYFNCDPGMGWKLVNILSVCCRRDDSNVATGINFSVAPSSSWSNSLCNHQELDGPQRLLHRSWYLVSRTMFVKDLN